MDSSGGSRPPLLHSPLRSFHCHKLLNLRHCSSTVSLDRRNAPLITVMAGGLQFSSTVLGRRKDEDWTDQAHAALKANFGEPPLPPLGASATA
jgi:hypothetical protein